MKLHTWSRSSEEHDRHLCRNILTVLTVGLVMAAVFWVENSFCRWYMGEIGKTIASLLRFAG